MWSGRCCSPDAAAVVPSPARCAAARRSDRPSHPRCQPGGRRRSPRQPEASCDKRECGRSPDQRPAELIVTVASWALWRPPRPLLGWYGVGVTEPLMETLCHPMHRGLADRRSFSWPAWPAHRRPELAGGVRLCSMRPAVRHSKHPTAIAVPADDPPSSAVLAFGMRPLTRPAPKAPLLLPPTVACAA